MLLSAGVSVCTVPTTFHFYTCPVDFDSNRETEWWCTGYMIHDTCWTWYNATFHTHTYELTRADNMTTEEIKIGAAALKCTCTWMTSKNTTTQHLRLSASDLLNVPRLYTANSFPLPDHCLGTVRRSLRFEQEKVCDVSAIRMEQFGETWTLFYTTIASVCWWLPRVSDISQHTRTNGH